VILIKQSESHKKITSQCFKQTQYFNRYDVQARARSCVFPCKLLCLHLHQPRRFSHHPQTTKYTTATKTHHKNSKQTNNNTNMNDNMNASLHARKSFAAEYRETAKYIPGLAFLLGLQYWPWTLVSGSVIAMLLGWQLFKKHKHVQSPHILIGLGLAAALVAVLIVLVGLLVVSCVVAGFVIRTSRKQEAETEQIAQQNFQNRLHAAEQAQSQGKGQGQGQEQEQGEEQEREQLQEEEQEEEEQEEAQEQEQAQEQKQVQKQEKVQEQEHQSQNKQNDTDFKEASS
jgi:hypothetical protein